jgi:hypothetical protein
LCITLEKYIRNNECGFFSNQIKIFTLNAGHQHTNRAVRNQLESLQSDYPGMNQYNLMVNKNPYAG